jgi:4-hydroxy-3-polyprenylbenzoate decarboxylase
VLPILVPSAPPSEIHVQRKLSERLALPMLRVLAPEIRDINFPLCGGVQQMLFVSFRKQFPRQARQVVSTLFGQRLCRGTKMMIAVDAEIDVRDEHQVWLSVSKNVDPVRDVFVLEGPGAMDDPAAPNPGLGSLLGIDATRKLPAEHQSRPWPPAASAPADVQRRVAEMCAELGFNRSSVTVPT